MSDLREVRDLLPLIPEGLPAGADAASTLRQRGHTVDPLLAELLRVSAPRFRLSEEARRRFRARIPKGTGFTVREGAPRAATPIAATPAYDVVLALRLTFANQVIAALRSEGVLPAQLSEENTALLFSPALLARFQLAPDRHHHTFPVPHLPAPEPGAPITGVPHTLTFPASPFLEAVNEPGLVEVAVPFRLEVTTTEPVHAIRTLLGRLRAQVEVDTQHDGDSGSIRPRLDFNATQALEVDYEPASQLVPRSAAEAAAIEAELRAKLATGLLQLPPIELPPFAIPGSLLGGDDTPAVPLRFDPLTTRQDGDAALVVGVQTLGNNSTPPPPASPFASATGNAFVRLHEGFLNRVFRQAALDPAFAEGLEEEAGFTGLKVDDASLSAHPDRLEARVEARIKNLCAFGIDLRFTAITRITFSLFNGELTVTRESELHLHIVNTVVCVLLGGIELFLLGLPVFLLDHLKLLRHLTDGIGDGSGTGTEGEETIVSATFTTGSPIPGTHQKVEAELLQQKVDSVAVLALGDLRLVQATRPFPHPLPFPLPLPVGRPSNRP